MSVIRENKQLKQEVASLQKQILKTYGVILEAKATGILPEQTYNRIKSILIKE